MDKDQFIQSIERFYAEGIEIIKKKNADYAGESNPFKNFENASSIGVDVKQAILVRVLDKISRIGNLLIKREARVKEETIQDALHDAANYLAILNARIEDENSQKPVQ